MPRISEATIAKHRQRTETALLDAWGELIDDRGYGDITLTLVAERAGVVRNTVYGYFPDKEHILFAYLRREVGRFMDGATAEVDATQGARERLRLLVERLARYFASNPGAGMEAVGVVSPERYADFAACFAPVSDLLVRILREGIDEGAFRPVDAAGAAQVTLSLLGAHRVPLTRGAMNPEAATDRVLDFLLHGIDSGAAETPD